MGQESSPGHEKDLFAGVAHRRVHLRQMCLRALHQNIFVRTREYFTTRAI